MLGKGGTNKANIFSEFRFSYNILGISFIAFS